MKAMWMGHFNDKISSAHARCRVTGSGCMGSSKTTYFIWNQRLQFAYSLYNFHGTTRTIKGSLRASTRILYDGFRPKIVPSKAGPKMAVFRELRGINVNLLFSIPEKAHPCSESRRLTYYAWKSVQGPGLWAVGRIRKRRSRVTSRIRGNEIP